MSYDRLLSVTSRPLPPPPLSLTHPSQNINEKKKKIIAHFSQNRNRRFNAKLNLSWDFFEEIGEEKKT